MTPDRYAVLHAVLDQIESPIDPGIRTPVDYAAAEPHIQAEAVAVLNQLAAAVLDRLRAVAAMSEWTAELYRQTVLDVETMLSPVML